MNKILIVVWIDTHFVELARVSRLLANSGQYKPILWFVNSYPTLARDLDTCRNEGWEIILPSSPSDKEKGLFYGFLRKFLLSISIELWLIIHSIFRFGQFKAILSGRIEDTGTIMARIQPSLILIPEDNIEYASHIIIQAGLEKKIRTVIIPFTIADASEAAEYFYDFPEFSAETGRVNRIVAKKYPQYVYKHRDKKLLRLPAGGVLAFESLGFGYSRPWVPNSFDSAILAVENERMFDYYRKDLPSDRLVITGALSDDALSKSMQFIDELQDGLRKQFQLSSGKPLLLCALPPDQFPRECQFLTFSHLLEFWMECLTSLTGWNVVVKPHPRLTEEEIQHLDSFGLHITHRDTAELIPLCDLYLASVSATIRWAIACGKPVINYDVYNMRYKDYSNVKGVITVYDKHTFQNILEALTTNPIQLNEVKSLQQAEAPRWGLLDGKSSERMLKLFDDVISEKIRSNP